MRILMLTVGSPHPPNTGGHQRTNLLYRSLSEIAPVDLVIDGVDGQFTPQEISVLRKEFSLQGFVPPLSRPDPVVSRLARPASKKVAGYLARYFYPDRLDYAPQRRFRDALSDLIKKNAYSLALTRTLALAAQSGLADVMATIADVDDGPIEVFTSLLADRSGTWSPAARLVWRRRLSEVRRVVPAQAARCAGLFVTKPQDIRYPGLENAVVLPNIPFPRTPDPGPLPASAGGCKTILFVGAYFAPNIRAVDWFIRNCWPAIRIAEPRAKFRVVGRGFEREARERWGSSVGVEIVGPVDDITGEYRNAAFTVAPMLDGAGSNIKVLESLSLGRACVVSHHAHRGYESVLPHGIGVLVAGGASEVTRSCVALLTDLPNRDAVAVSGALAIRRNFSYAAFSSAMASMVNKVMGGGANREYRDGDFNAG